MPQSLEQPTPNRHAATYRHVLEETQQGHVIRVPIYQELEKALYGGKCRIVTFFAAFHPFGLLDDEDADMLEEVLQNTTIDDDQNLVLVISSPGGSAVAAERIVNICRTYGHGHFSVIVPKMAKSAATMVCLGAKQVHMSHTSELGPIDPQILIREPDNRSTRYLAAHEILESYSELMTKANRSLRGRLEPYLQQLQRFDARDIRAIRSAQELSESIAVNCLQDEALAGKTKTEIKAKLKPFLKPRYTTVHERPIYHAMATRCGLSVEVHDVRSPVWRIVWKLYVRLSHIVRSHTTKVIETTDDSFVSKVVAAEEIEA
jgi:ATP-dependent protease ClpP protease subunit